MRTSTFQTVIYAFMSLIRTSANLAITTRSMATQIVDAFSSGKKHLNIFQSATRYVTVFGATILKNENCFLTSSGGTSGFRQGDEIASPSVSYDCEARVDRGTGRRIGEANGIGLLARITSMARDAVSAMTPTSATQAPSPL